MTKRLWSPHNQVRGGDYRVSVMKRVIPKEAAAGHIPMFVDNYRVQLGVLTPYTCLCGMGWWMPESKWGYVVT